MQERPQELQGLTTVHFTQRLQVALDIQVELRAEQQEQYQRIVIISHGSMDVRLMHRGLHTVQPILTTVLDLQQAVAEQLVERQV